MEATFTPIQATEELKQMHGDKCVRFFCDGHPVMNLSSGSCGPKGINVMDQAVYWDRSHKWGESILQALREVNPGKKFTAQYSD